MHGKTDYEVGNNTIFDILSEPIFDFIGSIGTMIDYYAALHPEIGTPVDLANQITFMVGEVSEIATVTTKEAKNLWRHAKMFKVRIINTIIPELQKEGCYENVDELCLDDEGFLFMFNKTTDNKVGTHIEKDEMILIFWED